MFKEILLEVQKNIERRLTILLEQAGKKTPKRLASAMTYGTLEGGKRLRPFLHISAAHLFEGDDKVALDIACALELIHCYSLIHDDLPGMDNSPLRRGKPSVHAAFDHSTALLAGSALQNLAFEILTDLDLVDSKRLRLIKRLAQASGATGMMGGQQLDMEAEKTIPPFTLDDISHLQRLKTGALIEYALEAAFIAFAPDSSSLAPLHLYGKNFGLVFQITDDLMDANTTEQTTGKPTQADENKVTLITHFGAEKAEKAAKDLVEEAYQALTPYGDKAIPLQQAIQALLGRLT